MTAATRILRRLLRRATKPLRLAVIAYLYRASEAEAERLAAMRADLVELERTERLHQVDLLMKRQAIERGYA